jgi:DNA end-binding protein Ku
MEILEFVRAAEVDPVYFESSYYLMPEEAGRRPYALLAKVMAESGYFAVAKLTMHNREYTVILRPHQNGIMLHTMYYQDEVRQVEKFGDVAGDLREGELKVARQLIEALENKWEPAKYHDTFEENLKKLIQAHLEGKPVTPVEKPRKLAPPADLMAALRESLEQLPKKPPQRVTAVAEPASAGGANASAAAHKRVAKKTRRAA